MVGSGAFGCQQQEDQIDRLFVDGFEIDRPFQPGEDAEQAFDSNRLAVGNGDAIADAGGAQPLAFQLNIEHHALR